MCKYNTRKRQRLFFKLVGEFNILFERKKWTQKCLRFSFLDIFVHFFENPKSQYNKIIYEALGGKGDDDYNKDTKIIKKIAKNVVIDKISKNV